MNKENINQALRFVAMGRTNHPLVDELVDGLAGLLDKPLEPEVLTIEITEPKRRAKKAD